MAKKNQSQFAILGILALSPNISGYDIRQTMAGSTDFFWKETFSSIYPVLRNLENEQMIVKEQDTSKGKRERYLYSLAPKGHQVLQEWLKASPEPQQVRSEILLKLFLGNLTTPSISVQHIQEHKQGLLAKKSTLTKIKKQLLEIHKDDKGLPYWLITLDHGMKALDASLQWSEESLNKLKKLKIGDHHE